MHKPPRGCSSRLRAHPRAHTQTTADHARALLCQVFGVAPWGGVALLGVVWMVQVWAPAREAATRCAWAALS
jgi:hypothetical protein